MLFYCCRFISCSAGKRKRLKETSAPISFFLLFLPTKLQLISKTQANFTRKNKCATISDTPSDISGFEITWQQSGSFKTLIQPNSGKMRSTSPAGDLKKQLCLAGKGLEKYLLTTWGHVYSVAGRKREERPDARRRRTTNRSSQWPERKARKDGFVVWKVLSNKNELNGLHNFN